MRIHRNDYFQETDWNYFDKKNVYYAQACTSSKLDLKNKMTPELQGQVNQNSYANARTSWCPLGLVAVNGKQGDSEMTSFKLQSEFWFRRFLGFLLGKL